MLEPRWKKSRTETALPKQAMPYVLMVLPMRMYDRREMAEPMDVKSSTLSADPSALKPYSESDEPRREYERRLILLPKVA
jgi:hypothetical protein